MADGHALGAAGRPRGVQDVGQVLGLAGHLEGRAVPRGDLGPGEQRDVRRRRPGSRAGVDQGGKAARPGLAVAAQQVAIGHHHGGTRVLEHVGHLGRGQAGVHGDGDAAGPVGGGVRDEPVQRQFGPQVDADPAARLETGLDQPARHGVGRTIPLGEGHRPDVDHGEGGAVTEFLGHTGQVIVHQHG